MKRLSLIAGVIIGTLGLVVTANAVERHFAARGTARALETIESGLDWDGVTPISQRQQTERTDANVDIWRTQQRQRNLCCLFGLLLVGGGSAAVVIGPKVAAGR